MLEMLVLRQLVHIVGIVRLLTTSQFRCAWHFKMGRWWCRLHQLRMAHVPWKGDVLLVRVLNRDQLLVEQRLDNLILQTLGHSFSSHASSDKHFSVHSRAHHKVVAFLVEGVANRLVRQLFCSHFSIRG